MRGTAILRLVDHVLARFATECWNYQLAGV